MVILSHTYKNTYTYMHVENMIILIYTYMTWVSLYDIHVYMYAENMIILFYICMTYTSNYTYPYMHDVYIYVTNIIMLIYIYMYNVNICR